MYKIIACDLDETLLDHDKKVSLQNRQAIAKARAAGVKFVLATGRPYTSARGTLQELDLFEQEDEYMLSYNGAVLTENKNERIFHFEGMDYEIVHTLFEKSKEYNVGVHIYTLDTVWGYRMSEDEWGYVNGRMEVKEMEGDDISFLKDAPLVKILFVNTDRAYLQKIDEDLKELTKDLDVSYSSNRYLEFNKKGVNKGEGLKKLAESLGVDIKDTIAIGDNYNDLSMIQAAGLGIGVANTVETMKPLCDVITKRTCYENAIEEVIKTYILNE
jgi:hypothetical protein